MLDFLDCHCHHRSNHLVLLDVKTWLQENWLDTKDVNLTSSSGSFGQTKYSQHPGLANQSSEVLTEQKKLFLAHCAIQNTSKMASGGGRAKFRKRSNKHCIFSSSPMKDCPPTWFILGCVLFR